MSQYLKRHNVKNGKAGKFVRRAGRALSGASSGRDGGKFIKPKSRSRKTKIVSGVVAANFGGVSGLAGSVLAQRGTISRKRGAQLIGAGYGTVFAKGVAGAVAAAGAPVVGVSALGLAGSAALGALAGGRVSERMRKNRLRPRKSAIPK